MMNNKIRIFLAVALAFSVSGHGLLAQTEAASSRLPTGPLIASSAPDFSQWEVDCRSAGGEKTAANARAPRIVQVSAIKTGAIQYEKTSYDDGSLKERWMKGVFIAVKEPGYRDIILRPRVEKAGDFPDFEWVSEGNYLGKARLESHDCIVFRQSMYPLYFSDPDLYKTITNNGTSGPSIDLGVKLEVTAWIDVATRLPVQLKIGNELRVYRFLAPPTAPLTLPEVFAKSITETEKRLQAITRPLSTP